MATIREMSDIQSTHMHLQLSEFLRKGWISMSDSVLVVCGWEFDQKVLASLEFENYLITSMAEIESAPFPNFQSADAENLHFKNESFDHVIVHAGLHHCYSPHRALSEMYRVARKTVIVFENQDSIVMKIALKFKLTLSYELEAVVANKYQFGGVANLPIPNYVYRWTKREVEKTIRSLDPYREPLIYFDRRFFYWFEHLDGMLSNHPIKKLLGKTLLKFLIRCAIIVLNAFMQSQGNIFTFMVRKHDAKIQPWLENKDGSIIMIRQTPSAAK